MKNLKIEADILGMGGGVLKAICRQGMALGVRQLFAT